MKHFSTRWFHLAIGLVVLPSTNGCSFIFVTPPSSDGRLVKRANDCTGSVAAPVVDSVIGGLEVARTVLAVASDDSDYDDVPITKEADIALGITATALFVGSAVYGFAHTSSCRRLRNGEKQDNVAVLEPGLQPEVLPPPIWGPRQVTHGHEEDD